MSTFEVPIVRLDDVYHHPNADRLSILRFRGYEAIAAKNEDGTHRFQKGEAVVYVPEAAVVPLQVLRERGYWNEKEGKGALAGKQGDRVKALLLRGVLSQGLVWKLRDDLCDGQVLAVENGDQVHRVVVGDDVADFFGITKYVPPIPAELLGKVVFVDEAIFDYDFESLKLFPDLFQEDEPVIVTEKLHGTFARATYMPTIEPRADMFGDGRVAITCKGMGAEGKVFLNVDAEGKHNVYVEALRELADRLVDLANLPEFAGRTVHLMGEVYGRGIQDLQYGGHAPKFAAFDIAVEDQFLDDDDKDLAFGVLGVDRVPILYAGPYNRDLMDELANGKTTAAECDQIREGIVITAEGDQSRRQVEGRWMRPIAKLHSVAYLTRKGGTEHQ